MPDTVRAVADAFEAGHGRESFWRLGEIVPYRLLPVARRLVRYATGPREA